MATTTGTFVWYNLGRKNIMNGLIDLDADNLKVALCSSSYTPAVTTDEYFDVITPSEISSGTGYTTGGQLLAGVAVTESAGTVKFDSNNPVWTASGGAITARFWMLYDDTPASNKPLIAYGLLNDAVADVTASSGNTLTVTVHDNGWTSTT